MNLVAAAASANMTAYAYRLPARSSTAQRPVVCDINITPLIDVMRVLLVTLIVSLPIMTHAVKVDMPQVPPSPDVVRPEVVDLEIDFDGTIVWNGKVVSGTQELERYLQAAARADPQPEIHLRPNRRAKYDAVAQVLASAQHHHLQKIGFVNTGVFGN
jgi:biopolymer transport protein ExbD